MEQINRCLDWTVLMGEDCCVMVKGRWFDDGLQMASMALFSRWNLLCSF